MGRHVDIILLNHFWHVTEAQCPHATEKTHLQILASSLVDDFHFFKEAMQTRM